MALALRLVAACAASLAASAAEARDLRTVCRDAAAAAELAHGLPPGLLTAIVAAESGFHPYALNLDGRALFPASPDEAADAIVAHAAAGGRNADVGCGQVSLRHHPGAFPTLRQALDPWTNATVAARILAQLRRETGSWTAAVAAYHTGRGGLRAAPERGLAYLCAVRDANRRQAPHAQAATDPAADQAIAPICAALAAKR